MKTDQQFNEIFEDYMERFSQTPVSQERKLILPIIALTVQGNFELIEQRIQDAVDYGVNPDKILEIIYQLEPVIGVGKVQSALTRAHRIIHKDPAEQSRDHRQDGKDIQSRIYGTEIRNLLADLPEGSGNFVADQLTNHFFGDFYQRKILTVAERELYELMALITLNVDFQIQAHSMGCLKAGNREAEIIWSVINMLPYIGFPLVINSIQKVHAAAQSLQNNN